MEGKYNTRSPAVKRLMKEALELSSPTMDYQAAPLEENLFEWHFTVRGPQDTDFQGGVYHGRIIVPTDYPMKPPDIIVLTPNGRFEVGKKICLSISGHHPETWQPSWSIRTALLAIIGFMPSPAQGTIGSLDYSPEERQALAKKSLKWRCSCCGLASSLLAPPGQQEVPGQAQEVKDIVQNLQIKSEEEMAKEKLKTDKEQLGDKKIEKNQTENQEDSLIATATNAAASSPGTVINTRPEGPSEPPPSVVRRVPPSARPVPQEESRGVQVYDFCIMLLVAAIAALLYRRIGIIQGSDEVGGLPDQE